MSDYHGVLVEPDAEWSLPALMRAARLSTWPFDHLVGTLGQFSAYQRTGSSSPQIDLSAGYRDYVRGRREAGSDYIQKTEGLARKLGREMGELRFTFHDSHGETLLQLMTWKRAQYLRSGMTDVFGVSWTGELLRRIAAMQTPSFAGVCSVLRVGDRVVAIHMGMRSGTSLHYWFPAYDSGLAKYSVGIILLLRVAEAAASLGVQTMDLGKGDSQYKQRLMTSTVPLSEGLVRLPSLWGTVLGLRQRADAFEVHGGLGKVLMLPLRLAKHIERAQRFR